MKRELGIRTLDLAKRLLDHGYHRPTVYFPLLVDEALLIEPTETETRETLDQFADAVAAILLEAKDDPQIAERHRIQRRYVVLMKLVLQNDLLYGKHCNVT